MTVESYSLEDQTLLIGIAGMPYPVALRVYRPYTDRQYSVR